MKLKLLKRALVRLTDSGVQSTEAEQTSVPGLGCGMAPCRRLQLLAGPTGSSSFSDTVQPLLEASGPSSDL